MRATGDRRTARELPLKVPCLHILAGTVKEPLSIAKEMRLDPAGDALAAFSTDRSPTGPMPGRIASSWSELPGSLRHAVHSRQTFRHDSGEVPRAGLCGSRLPAESRSDVVHFNLADGAFETTWLTHKADHAQRPRAFEKAPWKGEATSRGSGQCIFAKSGEGKMRLFPYAV